jgi:peptidoglycan/LPS O-acetylase OafA/YrhL
MSINMKIFEAKMSSSKTQTSHQDYAFINLLRGIAAVLVTFNHFYLNTLDFYEKTAWSQAAYPFLLGEFDPGKFSVGAFFLVSGFLIPYSLERSKSVKIFVIHRFFRLYPAYWFSILLNLGLNLWLSFEAMPSLWTLLANFTMAQGFLGQPDVIGAFWTLQIELVFYVLCVLIFCLGISRKTSLLVYSWIGLMVIASIIAHLGIRVPMALFIALALMYCADALRRNVDNVNILWITTAIALVPVCILAYGKVAGRYILCYWAAMIVFRLAHRYQAAWFKKPIYKFLADISYSIYLLHGPIGIQIARAIAAQGGSPFLAYGTALAATIVAAWITYKLLEHPAILLGRKFGKPKILQPSSFPPS